MSSLPKVPLRGMSLYLATVLLSVLGLGIAALLVGRTDWFAQHCDYVALQGVGYGQRLSSSGCDVLIYGDSTAAAGLDPAIIQRLSGLKTCNISEWTSVQLVVGTSPPLDEYLRRNPPPRVLLTTWAPKYFRPTQQPLSDYHVEGMWYAWRYGTWRNLLGTTFLEWTAKFVAWEINSLLKETRLHLMGQPVPSYNPLRLREERRGQWPFPEPPQQQCVLPDVPTAKRWEESVEEFRREYSSSGIRVIVDVSPIPDCDPHFEQYRQLLQGLPDNALERWPIRLFNNMDAHLGPDGSTLLSEEAAQQVIAAIDKGTSASTVKRALH